MKIGGIDTDKLKQFIPNANDIKSQLNNVSSTDIGSKAKEVLSKFDKPEIADLDTSNIPDVKGKINSYLEKIPKTNSFDAKKLIPQEFLDKLDTNSVINDMNTKISEMGIDINAAGIDINNIVSNLDKVVTGEGLDFSSLSSMPDINSYNYSNLGEFDMNEMESLINSVYKTTDPNDLQKILDKVSGMSL